MPPIVEKYKPAPLLKNIAELPEALTSQVFGITRLPPPNQPAAPPNSVLGPPPDSHVGKLKQELGTQEVQFASRPASKMEEKRLAAEVAAQKKDAEIALKQQILREKLAELVEKPQKALATFTRRGWEMLKGALGQKSQVPPASSGAPSLIGEAPPPIAEMLNQGVINVANYPAAAAADRLGQGDGNNPPPRALSIPFIGTTASSQMVASSLNEEGGYEDALKETFSIMRKAHIDVNPHEEIATGTADKMATGLDIRDVPLWGGEVDLVYPKLPALVITEDMLASQNPTIKRVFETATRAQVEVRGTDPEAEESKENPAPPKGSLAYVMRNVMWVYHDYDQLNLTQQRAVEEQVTNHVRQVLAAGNSRVGGGGGGGGAEAKPIVVGTQVLFGMTEYLTRLGQARNAQQTAVYQSLPEVLTLLMAGFGAHGLWGVKPGQPHDVTVFFENPLMQEKYQSLFDAKLEIFSGTEADLGYRRLIVCHEICRHMVVVPGSPEADRIHQSVAYLLNYLRGEADRLFDEVQRITTAVALRNQPRPRQPATNQNVVKGLGESIILLGLPLLASGIHSQAFNFSYPASGSSTNKRGGRFLSKSMLPPLPPPPPTSSYPSIATKASGLGGVVMRFDGPLLAKRNGSTLTGNSLIDATGAMAQKPEMKSAAIHVVNPAAQGFKGVVQDFMARWNLTGEGPAEEQLLFLYDYLAEASKAAFLEKLGEKATMVLQRNEKAKENLAGFMQRELVATREEVKKANDALQAMTQQLLALTVEHLETKSKQELRIQEQDQLLRAASFDKQRLDDYIRETTLKLETANRGAERLRGDLRQEQTKKLAVEKQLYDLEVKQEEVKNQFQEARKALQATTKEKNEMEAVLRAVSNKNLEGVNRELQKNLEALMTAKKELASVNENLLQDVNWVKLRLAESQREVKILERDYEEKRQALKQKEEEFNQERKASLNFESQAVENKTRAIELEIEVGELQVSLERAKGKLAEATRTENRMRNEYAEKIVKIQQEKTDLEARLKQNETDLFAYQQMVVEKEEVVAKLERVNAQTHEELTSLINVLYERLAQIPGIENPPFDAEGINRAWIWNYFNAIASQLEIYARGAGAIERLQSVVSDLEGSLNLGSAQYDLLRSQYQEAFGRATVLEARIQELENEAGNLKMGLENAKYGFGKLSYLHTTAMNTADMLEQVGTQKVMEYLKGFLRTYGELVGVLATKDLMSSETGNLVEQLWKVAVDQTNQVRFEFNAAIRFHSGIPAQLPPASTTTTMNMENEGNDGAKENNQNGGGGGDDDDDDAGPQ